MSILAGLAEGVGALGSLFGFGGSKELTPSQQIMSQAKGARRAAEKYGFNPLTLLGVNTSPGYGAGGSPMLASFDMLSGGLKDIADVTSGDAAQRRAMRQAELDLAKLELEQRRSGVLAVGPGLPWMGRNAVSRGNAGAPEVVTNPLRSSVSVAGVQSAPSMGWSDAQDVEDRFGDVASWVYGLGVVGADAWNTVVDRASKAGKKPAPYIADGITDYLGVRRLKHGYAVPRAAPRPSDPLTGTSVFGSPLPEPDVLEVRPNYADGYYYAYFADGRVERRGKINQGGKP